METREAQTDRDENEAELKFPSTIRRAAFLIVDVMKCILILPLAMSILVALLPAPTVNAGVEFTNLFSNGHCPSGLLVQGKDGSIYGTTENGGQEGGGTIYQIRITP